jgi:hypothetical protein
MITVTLFVPFGIPEKLRAGDSEAPSQVLAAGSSPSAPMAGSLTLNTGITLTRVVDAKDGVAMNINEVAARVRLTVVIATFDLII